MSWPPNTLETIMLLIKRLSQLAAVSALVLTSATSFANVPNPYGAIAYSPQDGIYGVATQNVELEAAEQEAMGNCAVINGGRSCRIVISFGNGCAALALSEDGAYGAHAARTTRGELMKGINAAYAGAREQCQLRGGTSCQLEQAFCSFDQSND